MFSRKRIEDYLKKIEKRFFIAPRQKFSFSENWFQEIPLEAGIYGIFNQNKLIYIGETGSLRGRMRDLGRTVNHQFRRSVGKNMFSRVKGFEEASSRKKFPLNIEKKLNKWMEQKLEIAVLPILFGRKEIEEYICKEYKPKCNTRVKRECRKINENHRNLSL